MKYVCVDCCIDHHRVGSHNCILHAIIYNRMYYHLGGGGDTRTLQSFVDRMLEDCFEEVPFRV